MKKIISYLCLFLFLLFAGKCQAEAGLSEVARTQYFKLNGRFGVMILPGGEGGKGVDSVTVFEYMENVNRLRMCKSRYEMVPTGAKGAGTYLNCAPVCYIENGMILNLTNDGKVFDMKTGEIAEYLKDTDDILEKIDLEYAKNNLDRLDMDPLMDDFGCGILILVSYIALGLLMTVILTSTLIVAKIKKTDKEKTRPILIQIYFWVSTFIYILLIGRLSMIVPVGYITLLINLGLAIKEFYKNVKNIKKQRNILALISGFLYISFYVMSTLLVLEMID